MKLQQITLPQAVGRSINVYVAPSVSVTATRVKKMVSSLRKDFAAVTFDGYAVKEVKLPTRTGELLEEDRNGKRTVACSNAGRGR